MTEHHTAGAAAFVYLAVPADLAEQNVPALRAELDAYAARLDLRSVQVFTDTPTTRGAAFAAMTAALDRYAVRHLIVPDVRHLDLAHHGSAWLVGHTFEQRFGVVIHALRAAP